MSLRGIGVAVAIVAIGVAIWAVVSLVDDDETAEPETEPISVDVGGPSESTTLVESSRWELIVSPEPALQLVRNHGTSTTSDYTMPVILDEASSFVVPRGGAEVTLVAGPVREDADTVLVGTTSGEATEAQLVDLYGLRWFWTEIPGEVTVKSIEAIAEDGTTLDEFTLPPMPVFDPGDIPQKPPGLSKPLPVPATE